MTRQVRLGLLVLVLAVLGFTVYLNRQSAGAAKFGVAADTPTFVGTVRLELDANLLARMDAQSPKLVLVASDGGRAPVLLWQVSNGQVVLQRFAGLQPSHYTSLEITWPDGSTEQFAVDVILNVPTQG